MAKRKSNRGGYAAKKSIDKAALLRVIAVLAFLVAVVYVTTSLAMFYRAGAPIWNPLKWGKPAAAQPDSGIIGDGSGEDVLTLIESNGISVAAEVIEPEEYAAYSVAEYAETAYRITATIEPENPLDSRLVWSTKWLDSKSEWANGKITSYYVKANQEQQYSNIATLTCYEAFGEPVLLTISGYSNPDINCVVQVDFVKHLEGFEVVVNPDMPDVPLDGQPADTVRRRNLLLTGYNQATQFNQVKIVPQYGVGTVEGKVTNIQGKFTIPSGSATSMKNGLTNDLSEYIAKGCIIRDTITISTTSSSFVLSASDFVTGNVGPERYALVSNFFYTYGVASTAGHSSGSGMANFSSDVPTVWTVTYAYGNVYTETTTTNDNTPYRVCNDGLKKIETITSITPDTDHIVFS